MNKNNKAYIRPDMRVVKLQHSPLLEASDAAGAPRRHVIEDDTAY